MMKRILVISILWTFAMINASANKVAKSFCGVTTQGCVSFTEAHEESNDMYGKNIKTEDSSKEKMCLPVDVMTLLAYQAKGNERVERYLTKHGFKYEGRFVPEDLNPEFYFQKKYCKGCTVNKKGEVKNIKGQKNENRLGCMVEIGSLGFGLCTTITVFDKTGWQAIISLLKSKGFKEYKNEDSECSLVRNKTCVDFWNNSNNTCGLTIWTDNLM